MKAKPFIVSFLAVVAAIAAFSIYLSAIVDRTEKSLTAVLSPDKKMKAVKLSLAGGGRSPFCIDSFSVMLSTIGRIRREPRIRIYSAPCGRSDGAPLPVKWPTCVAGFPTASAAKS